MLANNKVLRGRYRIIQPLGQGAAGAVYEAYDSERETNVALKEILIDLEKVSNISLREKIKHDFANQAKILAKVKHESLPQVRGYFAEVDRHYLIMELVDGDDVSEILTKGKDSVPLSEITDWADQLLDTLDYLHTITPSIVHRDINPANVKLTSRGKIKLLGFNIANNADAEASMTVKTHSSAAILNYLPLEQIVRVADETSKKKLTDNHGERLKKILKQPIDARSDIYALGATIYHLMTAQIPMNALERTLKGWTENADPLLPAHQANASVPKEISEILSRAMEIESENRFETAMQMRQALQTAVKKSKERTAEEARKQEAAAARESFLVEEKRLEQERQIVEQERQRVEAERKQQAELIERQLKEAEAQRIEAEKRAAEAEKRLSENQKTAEKSASVTPKFAKLPENGGGQSNSNKANGIYDEPQSLFSDVPPPKSSWIMPVAGLAVLVFAGIIAGILFMRSSNAAEAKKPTVDSSSVMAEKVTPDAPTAAPSGVSVEKISETTAMLPTSASPNSVAPAVSQNVPKIKAAPPTAIPKAVKPVAAAPPTKAPANQKKAVTVDDLIGN